MASSRPASCIIRNRSDRPTAPRIFPVRIASGATGGNARKETGGEQRVARVDSAVLVDAGAAVRVAGAGARSAPR